MVNHGNGQVTTQFPINRDLVPMLDAAFGHLQARGLLGELDTFDGSWNPRMNAGGGGISAHAWGIAIDINAATNPYLREPHMNPEVVQAFTDSGFTWGGTFTNPGPDGMHFSLGF
jgi:D-alanyl-D-alanine carboxypeptidase